MNPSKMAVYGSNNINSGWTLLGSYSNQLSWADNEQRSFSADTTKGYFTYIKAVGQRVSQAGDEYMALGDIGLYGTPATLCSANQRVVSHACQAYPAGTTNTAGDNASGGDTTCNGESP
uniref:Uncharacterized protein n=1 Tax=Chromera velia CCMP2878 TaxID=1169474 RepID=A0A0G4GKP4_9ALVE|eukprot:Cvel_22336.t1-p1 / transcript=Cvel_22336.t1 / gene=Cvel_22336 / organism=Chromera_velia_CCMP2878 / gene_product=hypothetical protein / transcript_product=hypothetical protein / location=Cvel_scaffold2186:7008-9194(+) / protein_length=118 / sequence_SO=supercontig / SO=protein_coding / is_pseudo=false